MLAEVDSLARGISIAGIVLAFASFAYVIYRDRRDRPDIDFSASAYFIIEGNAYFEVSLVARNRGSRDVGVEGIEFRSLRPRGGCFIQMVYPEKDGDDRMLQRRRTLQARHSFEWKAVPRYTCLDGDLPDRASLIAVVMLGDGKEIKSNPVDVPTRLLKPGEPYEIRLEDLDDRNWSPSGEDAK